MAMRRSRIQIKPNTGPRAVGKAATSDNNSAKDSPSNTPLSPVKKTPQSPVKAQNSNAVVRPSPSSPIKPPPQRSTISEATEATKPSASSLTGRSLNLTKPSEKIIEDDQGIIPTPHENTNTSYQNQKDESSNSLEDTDKTCDTNEMCNKTVNPPKQRTRLKKLLPKIPGHRQAPKQVEKVSSLNEPETTVVSDPEPTPPVQTIVAEDTITITSSEETCDDPVFKKPEVPNRKSQPVRPNNSASECAPSSSVSETPIIKSATAGRSWASREAEAVKRMRKNRTQFKQTEPPDRAKMTIMDLIHWNPIQNPMTRCNDSVKANASNQSLESEPDQEIEPSTEASKEKENEDFVPGPRVIVGEDGQITLDESSLVIEQTAPEKDLSEEVVYETSDTTYSSYSKKVISRQFWSMKETAMFYKALSVVGTDFALMSKFFPKRSRTDLKRKFKKEERTRRDLLDKAVTEWHKFDLNDIQDFLFCKELQTVNDQEGEEARVDNPDAVEEISRTNNYVRENLLNVIPKRRGRPPGQKNKKKDEKANGTQKEKKSNKRQSLRNAWSDEEAEPVEDEDVTEIMVIEDDPLPCQEPHNDDNSCECCQLKTKTSKRQKTMEAKKRKIQELEEERSRYLLSTLGPVRDAPRSPSPEIISDSIPFTIITNQTLSRSVNRLESPLRAQLSPASLCSPNSSNGSTPAANMYSGIGARSPSNLTMQSTSSERNKVQSPSPATLSTALRLPSGSASVVTGVTPNANVSLRSPPHLSVQSTSSGQGRGTSIPKQVNLVNINNSVAASPILQALLNKAPGMSGASTGQILLVSDKTADNEQVLHVYLVSPNNTQNTTQSSSEIPPSGSQFNEETLRRLGIRPIGQQKSRQSDEPPESKG